MKRVSAKRQRAGGMGAQRPVLLVMSLKRLVRAAHGGAERPKPSFCLFCFQS
jgi:hypothetical protein